MSSRIGLAAVMLERGNAAECAALLEQVVADAGDHEVTLRAGALELLVRARATLGDLSGAQARLNELERIAARLDTPALAGSAAFARGTLALARSEFDAAARALESAAAHFERSGAPFETARARAALSGAYTALGLHASAEREARLAAEIDERLRGAPAPAKRGDALTSRQLEILRYICRGMSNSEIAAELRLSDHTVKRHVANVLMRLDLPSRAAAAAFAVREGLV